MRESRDSVTITQLTALGFLTVLSPLIHGIPGNVAGMAGSAAWVSALLVFVPLALYMWIMGLLIKNRRQDEGLSEMIVRALGKPLGKAFLLINALWLMFFTAYLLHIGAARFVETVYPHASPWFFLLITLAMCAVAAFGRSRSLIRTAQRFCPVIVVVLALIIILSLPSVDVDSLLPVSQMDAVPVLYGLHWSFSITSVIVYTGFLFNGLKPGKKKRHGLILSLSIAVTAALLVVCCLGNFGASLTGRLSHPFFSVIRNISLFDVINRFEAIVVVFWVATDFFLISALLLISSRQLKLVFGLSAEPEWGKKASLWANGRWTVWLSVILISAAALFIGLGRFSLDIYSKGIIPMAQLITILGVYPLILLVGKLRKTI